MQSHIVILKKSTHLISVPHHKLSCSIIYSDSLSQGSGPWGHGQYAHVFSVTCMEQLNAQKLLANQGEGMKVFHYICSYSLMRCFFSLQAAHNEASALFVRHHHVVWISTHLWTYCTNGWGQCQPGEAVWETMAEKLTLLWSVSSSFQCLRRKYARGNEKGGHSRSSARCCVCVSHHLQWKDREVYRWTGG